MLNRWIERGLLDTLEDLGVGCIAFSPLAQGMLTAKYLEGVPADARAGKGGSLRGHFLSEENLSRIRALNAIAQRRGQSLAQMAIAWVLRDPRVTSALIGARSVAQLDDSLDALSNLAFDEEELREIDTFARDSDIDLWAGSERLTPADLPRPRFEIEEFAREGDLDLWAESESYGPAELPKPRLG